MQGRDGVRPAAGTARRRRHAAAAIHSAWSSQTWAKIVPLLLAAGLDPGSRELLLDGLAGSLVTTNPEAESRRRREAVMPLSSHDHAAVRAFANQSLARIDSLSTFFQNSRDRARNGYAV